MDERSLKCRSDHSALRLLLPVMAAAILMLGWFWHPMPAAAASGNVYACTIHPCYRHPVTGVIEDSGGEAAYTTGQGMVEGCISTKGMLEVTDDGHTYLTIEMSLIDYTKDQTFQVQNRGDSEWMNPPIGVTGEGSDENGRTYHITMEVPAQECVVRGSMYVEPMGRSVIFYLYPSDFTEADTSGANGFTATMVTAASNGSAPAVAGDGSAADTQTAQAQTEAADTQTVQAQTEAADTQTAQAQTEAADTQTAQPQTEAADTQTAETDASASGQQSEKAGGIDTSAGLALSTEAGSGEDKAGEAEKEDSHPAAKQILVNVISGVLIGVILLIVAAVIVFCFLKNRNRWFGDSSEDYDGLYREESDQPVWLKEAMKDKEQNQV